MTTKNEKKIKIIPLGGLGQIGNHLTIFEYEDDIIVVDAGMMFPNDKMPGIDFLIPDMSYLKKNSSKVRGIIITHGHEDHIGAVPFLLKEITAPIYGTKLTLGFIKKRLEERTPAKKPSFIEIAPGDCVNVGNYLIEFIKVNHSIADCVGLAIETDLGAIIHTGDFKIDYSPIDNHTMDLHRFAKYGEKGVLLLLSDSTNAEVKGHTRSESILAKSFNNIFSSSKGRLFVATFASNIHRIQQVLNAASKYNRNVVLSGITIQKNIGIAIDLNYLSFKDGLLIDLKEAKSLPDKKLAIICTGTQGEPMSALTKMASGKHKHFNIGEGDTVIISASIIPGNEKTVNDVVSSLLKMGAKVHYASDEDIHVSGHAFEDELKLMLSITKPKFFMPIHGEYKHLNAHAKIAEFLNMKSSRIMIAENGDVLSLTKKSFQKEDFLHLKTIFVDGTETGSIESETIKDRIVMSEDGLIVITALIVNREYKPPLQFLVKGFMAPSKKGFYDAMTREIEQKLEMLLLDDEDTNKISSQLKSSLVKYVHRMTKRNPIIEVQVLEV